MNFNLRYLRFSSLLVVALISACASSPEQRRAEEYQRLQDQRAQYQWQVDFCRNKGITAKDSTFSACIDWAKAEQDLQAAQIARCSPNWFRIAGAFAQPQLGGFTASLGSANQELARQRDVNGCN